MCPEKNCLEQNLLCVKNNVQNKKYIERRCLVQKLFRTKIVQNKSCLEQKLYKTRVVQNKNFKNQNCLEQILFRTKIVQNKNCLYQKNQDKSCLKRKVFQKKSSEIFLCSKKCFQNKCYSTNGWSNRAKVMAHNFPSTSKF